MAKLVTYLLLGTVFGSVISEVGGIGYWSGPKDFTHGAGGGIYRSGIAEFLGFDSGKAGEIWEDAASTSGKL